MSLSSEKARVTSLNRESDAVFQIRAECFDEWLKKRAIERQSWETIPATPWIADREKVKESITDHLPAYLDSDLLITDTDFKELAKISMFGSAENLFESPSTLPSREDN
jgi:hypothetical protein